MEHATHPASALLRVALACLLACMTPWLVSCSDGNPGGAGAPGAQAAASGAVFSPPPQPSMPVVDTGADEPIDTSHANDGYVCARATGANRLKFQVSRGDAAYNYDLPNDGRTCVFPINMGNGPYLFRIMQNTEGSNYVETASAQADVTLSSEFAPFLLPNQFCDYDEDSSCVTLARQLTESASNEGEAVQAVCTYIVDNIGYDTAKAERLSTGTGYIPDPDATLDAGSGVCFDYASLGAAMLRSLGIPTKIITGYVSPGDLYHAWIMVYADGTWHAGEFSVDPETWSRVDLTFAAAGSGAFTGNGTSYTERYVY